jgi:organic hydroperoxide reductase OsmC/OhrA
MDGIEQSNTKRRSFTYKTSTCWTGGRSGTLAREGKPTIHVSSLPEFKGESDLWTPEEMFVASVEISHMSTVMSLASEHQLQVLSYKSHANGVLECVDGDYRFTRIVIFLTITVAASAAEAEVHAILREAQKHCLVANSIASIVEVNPTIVIQ